MTLAAGGSPNRRRDRRTKPLIESDFPKRWSRRSKVELDYLSTAAGTEHDRLPWMGTATDDIQPVAEDPVRIILDMLNRYSSRPSREESTQPVPNAD